MKQRNVKKKIGSLLLVAAMIITSFPAFGTEVQAAEARSAVPGQFVTKEQLKTFNTDDSDGSVNPAKVYFGKNNGNNQEWWIAGSQKNSSVTLFAASPLATGQKFDSNYNYNDNLNTRTKQYSADWGCTYDNAPSDVYANHYGGSSLRTVLKGMENSCFSTAEQALMQRTTIYTKDTKNSCVYSTTDKLYLAYAGPEKDYVTDAYKYITVGENASSNLINGLRIDKKYMRIGDSFWLRSLNTDVATTSAQIVTSSSTSSSIYYDILSYEHAVAPAFELDLSSVLFASAAKAALSDSAESGTIADDAAMTLRLDGAGKTIGTVSYDAAAGMIVAQKAAGAAGTVTLVVQGKGETSDWYYSVPAGEVTVVTKEQIETACSISGLNLAECKIWLETTEGEDSFAYAKMAEAKNFNDAATLAPGQILVREDEMITNGQDGTVTIDKGNDGNVDVTVKLPSEGNVDIDADGTVTVPAGATVQAAGGKELTLPKGGTVNADGKVEADRIVNGDTTVTAPEGGKVTADKAGNITVPDGGTVETGDGEVTTLPNGGTVDKDGNIEADKIVNGDTTVTAPEGGKVTADKAGNITVPAGGKVETGDGKELTLPNGGTVDKDGNIEADKIVNGDTTVTAPEGGKVTADKAGNITVPAGGKVETGDRKELTLPNGGIVDKDEKVEADKIVSGNTIVAAPEGGSVTAGKNENIMIPAGGKVETESGKELTLSNGGSVDKDGNVEADKIVNGDTTVTAPEGGNLTADKAGNITVPAGGTVETGDGKVTTLPNGGTVDKDGNVSAGPSQPTNPPTNPPTPSTNPPKTVIPAGGKVETESGKELTLPNGGSVDKDGNVEADKIVNGDTTVTAPEGGNLTADKAGNITVPAGGKIETGDGKELTLPNGGTVDKDGNVEADKIVNGDTTVTAPEGGNLTADKAGNITVPAGGTVETGDGKVTTLPNGGTVDKDGNVSAGPSQPTNPPTNPPTPSTNPPKTVIPAGGKVETESGKVLTLPNGGSVDEDGNIEADKIVNGDTTITAPEGGSLTADKAGNITVPAGGKVETGDGKEMTLPNGGTVDKDEKVEADKIVSGNITVTAPEGGKVTADKAGNITVPAGGTVQTGDGEVTTLPNGGTVDKDGTISQTPLQTTNPSTTSPTNPPANPGETVSPEEVAKNSEKLNSGISVGWKGNSISLGWQAVPGAEGYDIFADQCGKKLGKKSLIKTVKGNKTSVSLAKIAGKKLSGKKNYKVRIKAWKYIGGKKVYIGSSNMYHVVGRKHKKYTNAKKLKPAKKKYTLRKGKNVSLKVRIVKQSKKKKLLPKSHGPKLRYFSDNKEVATVTSKGKVRAKGSGTCYVYVTALNGISIKIKITVK